MSFTNIETQTINWHPVPAAGYASQGALHAWNVADGSGGWRSTGWIFNNAIVPAQVSGPRPILFAQGLILPNNQAPPLTFSPATFDAFVRYHGSANLIDSFNSAVLGTCNVNINRIADTVTVQLDNFSADATLADPTSYVIINLIIPASLRPVATTGGAPQASLTGTTIYVNGAYFASSVIYLDPATEQLSIRNGTNLGGFGGGATLNLLTGYSGTSPCSTLTASWMLGN